MNDRGIHCRTPLDVAAYTKAYESYSPMDDINSRLWAARKPCLIYIPLHFEKIEDDNNRPTDLEFNRKVDQEIQDSLARYNLKYLTLSANSPEERVQEILSYWSNYVSESVLG